MPSRFDLQTKASNIFNNGYKQAEAPGMKFRSFVFDFDIDTITKQEISESHCTSF